jgi:hypothetical protein
VQRLRTGVACSARIEDGWQRLVFNTQGTASGLGNGGRIGNNCGHPLANETHDVIENNGIIGIFMRMFVPGCGKQQLRRVGMRQHALHTCYGQRIAGVNANHSGMCVRRAQQLQVQYARQRDIESEARSSSHDIAASRSSDRSDVGTGDIVDGVGDSAIAGAAAEIAFHRRRQISALGLVQACSRQNHAGRAVSALKALAVEKLLLHGVQAAADRQTLNRRNAAAFSTERGRNAGVNRFAIEKYGAGAAVAAVATSLHTEPARLAQQRSQTLAGAWFSLQHRVVDPALYHDLSS